MYFGKYEVNEAIEVVRGHFLVQEIIIQLSQFVTLEDKNWEEFFSVIRVC